MTRYEAQGNVVYDNELGKVETVFSQGSQSMQEHCARRAAAARNKEEQDRAAIDELMRSNRSLCG